MGDYGTKALKLQIVQGVVHGGWDGDFIELDKEIIMLVDAEARSALSQSLDVFGVQVKVASSGQLQPVSEFTLQTIA